MCPCFTRRQFIKAAGGTAAALSLLPLSESILGAQPMSRTPIFPKGKAKVTMIFSHRPSGQPSWPTKEYDYDGRAKTFIEKYTAGCPQIDFTFKHALTGDEANAIIKEGDVDGYVVACLGIWTGAPSAIMHSGKPVVLVDDLFAGSGEVLIQGGVARREKLPVVVVSSSDFQDGIDAANLFPVIRAMKESTILDVSDHNITAWGDQIKANIGPTVIPLTTTELASYYEKADPKEAAEWADMWIGQAKKMIEPTRDEILKSGRMYLALSRAATEKKADAVTMDCLGTFYSGRVSAYPCLSHFQMNNDGSTGVCEGDLNSTCTQLMMRYLTGRPGYVSDPVIDTAKEEIIYAHCVSTNRVFGPKGKANPYIIRSHAEDGKGASVQSLMPVGEKVTTLEIDVAGKRMRIHSGKTTRNVDEPKACRTKLAAKTNAQAILDNWDMGWHRVTLYGDYRKQAMNLARLLGISVFEEDKES
ncbi:MAG TPA: twin-arginine translocation signal domain-containing protein [Armatimonadota bacterium]|nr:twin-arginine translocation signal domain-containing protein [Armatimonadota bacterium]